ncbi:hypothetical protein COOONC_15490 [Cooperia oncophora]
MQQIRRRPILLGVIVLLLLFLTLIGVLLFYLFRPAKTEDDIEYFHQEVKSPPVDFDNVKLQVPKKLRVQRKVLATVTTTLATTLTQDNSGEVQDCSEHLDSGKGSGIYLISPSDAVPFPVFCDQETAGGGWTVIRRRVSSKVHFHNRTWDEYANGFGDLDG